MEKEYHLPVLDEGRTYQNPLAFVGREKPPTNPDPYILKFAGQYYCYSSDKHGVNISRSKDLVHWTYLGLTAKEEDKQEYWAPCVIYDNGTFYMYCSNMSGEKEDHHKEFLQLYTSAAPEGPFTYRKTFFNKFSIDAHVVKDHDGEVYLFYAVNDYMGTDGSYSGTSILVDRLIDFTELAHEEKPVVLPSIDEEVYAANRFGDGRDWYTIEGGFFFRRHLTAYLMYAANAFVHENYFLGYSTAQANTGISDMEWKKYPDDFTFEPLVRRNEIVEGTGHNSVAKAPNLVDDWLVYHGREAAEELIEGKEQRTMRIDPILYNGDYLRTNAPSYKMQDAPEPAYLSVEGGMDKFEKSMCRGAGFFTVDFPFPYYLMEADLCADLTHMGGRYGVLLSYQDPANYLEVEIDSGKRRLTAWEVRNNFREALASARLSANYNHEVLHNIKAERTFTSYRVLLDDVPLLKFTGSLNGNKIGCLAKYTVMYCPYLAATPHAELFGDRLHHLPGLYNSSDCLHLTDSAVTVHSKQEAAILEKTASGDSMKMVEFTLNAAGSRAEIIVKEGGRETTAAIYDQPGTYTVYIKKKNNRTAVFSDGHYRMLEGFGQEGQQLVFKLFKAEILSYEFTLLSKE